MSGLSYAHADVADGGLPDFPGLTLVEQGGDDLDALSDVELLRRVHGEEADQRDTILLVDDQMIQRRLLEAVLGQNFDGYRFEHADDGDTALEMLGDPAFARRLALISTDFNMSRVSGVEFAEGIRGINGYGHALSSEIRGALHRVPVVLNTGSVGFFEQGTPENAQVRALLDAGVLSAVLMKRGSIDDISKGMRKALQASLGAPVERMVS